MSEENKEEEKQQDGYTAFCTECQTVLPDATAEKDPHLQAGHSGVCGLCGGVVSVARTSDLKQAMHRAKSRRGLS